MDFDVLNLTCFLVNSVNALLFTYGNDRLTLYKENMHRIRVAQKAMEHATLGVTQLDKIRNRKFEVGR